MHKTFYLTCLFLFSSNNEVYTTKALSSRRVACVSLGQLGGSSLARAGLRRKFGDPDSWSGVRSLDQ